MSRRTAILAGCLALCLAPSVFAVQEGYDAGNRCPDFELYDTEGRPTRLSQFRGKVVLLQLFATW